MKLIFFKGKSLLSRIITTISGWIYSHVGIQIDDYYYEAWHTWNFLDSKILKCLHYTQYHKANTPVDIIDIPWNFDKLFLDTQVWVAYDFKAILWYIFPIKQNPNKWYCSELVYKYLVLNKILKSGEKYPSPSRLYELIKDNGTNKTLVMR